MSKVRVAIIHNTIAPYRHPLFEELSKKVELTVYYCAIKHTSRAWDLWPRNYNYNYEILPGIFIRTPMGETSLNLSIIKKIMKKKPHIIIIGGYTDLTMWLAFFVSKILKTPVIYWTEGIKEPYSILGILTRPLRIFFIKKSDAIIVPGKLSRQYVINLGAVAEKVFIAPNSIDNDLFIKLSQQFSSSKEVIKRMLGLENKIVILTVAQLIERKGIEFLLHAYKRLELEHKDVALIIIGSGPLKYKLKRLSQDLGIENIRFIYSGLKLEELVKYYCISDIFVLPTLEDVWGFVINEAMVCGLPVVSTRASQAAWEMIIPNINGYIIEPAHVDQLYSTLKALISNPILRKRMGERARDIALWKFNVTITVMGFLSAINYCFSSHI
jgi:glycosyltransferase involved in cell wall biosynthesis